MPTVSKSGFSFAGWYTSKDGTVVEPDSSADFGATIVSNTYENGKGVIKFNKDLYTIGQYAFDECSALATIYVPAKKAGYYKKRLPEQLHDKIVELQPEKKTKK